MSEDEGKVSEGQIIDRLRTFPRFGDLPQELKDKIWDFAVRIDVPGLHFFTTTFRKDPDQDDNRIRSVDKVEIVTTWEGDGFYQLSIPTDNMKPRNFPINRNPSAYSVDDTALWRVCHESRRALQRTIGCSLPDLRCLQCELPRGVSCYYIGSNGIKQYFDVKQSDLVCFQPLSWRDIGFETSVATVSIVERLGVPQIAMNFDPNWKTPTTEDFSEEDPSAKLPIYSQAAHNLDHLWFIDYRIRRRDQPTSATPVRADRQAFYGNGCRLVEVRLYDYEFEFEDGSPLDPVDRLVDCSQASATISRDSNPFTFNYKWQLASKAERSRVRFDRPNFKHLRRSWRSLKDTDTDQCWELGWLRLHVLAFELC